MASRQSVQDLCREATPAIIERVARIARQSKSEAMASRAAMLLLDRGWGRRLREPEPQLKPGQKLEDVDSIKALWAGKRRYVLAKKPPTESPQAAPPPANDGQAGEQPGAPA